MRNYNSRVKQILPLSEPTPESRDFWEEYELAIVAFERFSRSCGDPRATHYAELLNEFNEEISRALDPAQLDSGLDGNKSTKLLEIVKD